MRRNRLDSEACDVGSGRHALRLVSENRIGGRAKREMTKGQCQLLLHRFETLIFFAQDGGIPGTSQGE